MKEERTYYNSSAEKMTSRASEIFQDLKSTGEFAGALALWGFGVSQIMRGDDIFGLGAIAVGADLASQWLKGVYNSSIRQRPRSQRRFMARPKSVFEKEREIYEEFLQRSDAA